MLNNVYVCGKTSIIYNPNIWYNYYTIIKCILFDRFQYNSRITVFQNSRTIVFYEPSIPWTQYSGKPVFFKDNGTNLYIQLFIQLLNIQQSRFNNIGLPYLDGWFGSYRGRHYGPANQWKKNFNILFLKLNKYKQSIVSKWSKRTPYICSLWQPARPIYYKYTCCNSTNTINFQSFV